MRRRHRRGNSDATHSIHRLAVHHGEGENPHAHLMFSERANDGIARSAEQWFRRHNPKAPDQGGANKSEATKPKAWLEQTRASWAEQANRALSRPGRSGSQQRSCSSRALASTRRLRMTPTTATFRGFPSATS